MIKDILITKYHKLHNLLENLKQTDKAVKIANGSCTTKKKVFQGTR